MPRPSMSSSSHTRARSAARSRAATNAMDIGNSQLYGEVIATLFVTSVMVVFSEIIPKSVFRAHPDRLVLALLPVIRFFYYVLSPLDIVKLP